MLIYTFQIWLALSFFVFCCDGLSVGKLLYILISEKRNNCQTKTEEESCDFCKAKIMYDTFFQAFKLHCSEFV